MPIKSEEMNFRDECLQEKRSKLFERKRVGAPPESIRRSASAASLQGGEGTKT